MAEKLELPFTWLGRSGLEVSNLCLGTMTFGKSAYLDYQNVLEQEQANEVMDRFVEAGGNFLDTANVYTGGRSEQIIGNWMQMRQNRDSIVLATKVRFPMAGLMAKPVAGIQGLGRRHIIQQVEASLERLQTHYIDLYQTHGWDSATPLDETLRTLDDLVRSGKVRHVGASNLSGWQLQKAVAVCDKWGYSPYISLQQQYSLMSRESELESFRVCQNEGIGVLPWSPLKGGLLSGKFKRGVTLEESKASNSRVGFCTKNDKVPPLEVFPKWENLQHDEWTLNLLDKLHEVATETGRSAAQVSLRWLLQKDVVSSVIIGCTRLSQLEDNLQAANTSWSLSPDQMKSLDEASDNPKPYPYKLIDGANASRINPH